MISENSFNQSLLNRKYWIFDLDGTLTVPIHDFAAIRVDLGIPAEEDILKYITAQERSLADRMLERLDEIEIELAERTAAAEGTSKLIKLLHGRGCQFGIITRNTDENARRSLDKIGILSYFENECILGRTQAPPKPDPAGIFQLLNRWQATPDQAVMVGDYLFDLQAGKAAGTATIHVNQTDSPRWNELTDIFVNSLQQLVRYFATSNDFSRYEN